MLQKRPSTVEAVLIYFLCIYKLVLFLSNLIDLKLPECCAPRYKKCAGTYKNKIFIFGYIYTCLNVKIIKPYNDRVNINYTQYTFVKFDSLIIIKMLNFTFLNQSI